jgi:DNA-binding NarL/FixJ family response regulator
MAALIKVLLVDDHAVVREGYRRLLERDTRILVVGEASNGAQACALAGSVSPHVIVMDIALPGGSGLEAMRLMLARQPELKVLIFSMHGEAIFVSRALNAGARGYITKSSAPEVLVEAVLSIAHGEAFLSPDVSAFALTPEARASKSGAESLTTREFEIFRLLAQGESVKEISEKLNLSDKTVANHQSVIREKLGVQNGVQLARIAAELGVGP